MGIKLGSIIPARPVEIAQLRGQRLAVDGYNLLYQFLASIRQRDGIIEPSLMPISALHDTERPHARHLARQPCPVAHFDYLRDVLVGTRRLLRHDARGAGADVDALFLP